MQTLRKTTSFNEYCPCDSCYFECLPDKLTHFFLFSKQPYNVNTNGLLKTKIWKQANTLESGFESRLSGSCATNHYITGDWSQIRESELATSLLIPRSLCVCRTTSSPPKFPLYARASLMVSDQLALFVLCGPEPHVTGYLAFLASGHSCR